MTKKYIAVRRLKYAGGFIEAGQPIPDAESWKSLKALLSNGWVAIATADVVAVAAPPTKKKAKPSDAMAKPKKEEPKKQEAKKEKPKKKLKSFLKSKKNDEVNNDDKD